MAAVDRDVVLASESGNGKIDLRHAIRPRLGFTVLTVERASRSLWASLEACGIISLAWRCDVPRVRMELD